ncbi:MAG: mechanosensitive ion channel family protein [Betaproteobacteria bacterium]|nr:mechanosensitive ion channel family protein [Betaproteobacteria bacterium]
MNTYDNLSSALASAFSQVTSRIGEYLPNLLGAVVLLLAGWIVARLLRGVAVKLMHVLELLFLRLSRGAPEKTSRIPSAAVEIVGSILFWVVMLFFVAAATHVLGLGAFSSWLQGLVTYLPTLMAGALIILAGVLLSGLARDLTVATLPALPERQRVLLGRIVQGTILVTAVAVGADQIGIKITFLVILAAVVTGAVVGGVALAVSLGARSYVANLIGAYYVRQAFRAGQRVRVGNEEGMILEITAVSIVLETEQGRLSIPAKVYNEEPIALLAPRSADA